MQERPKVWIWVCIVKDDKVLFGKRKNAHGDGYRWFPGWHLEYWESWIDCVIRETKEETNLDINDVSFLHVTNDIFTKEKKHYITIFMKSDNINWEFINREPDRFETRERFERDNLPAPLFLSIQNMINDWISPFDT